MIFKNELNAKKPALNATAVIEPTGALYPAIEPFKYPSHEPKIFRIKQVINTTGIARSTLYTKIAAGEFPRPISLGSRSVGWRSQDIYDFMSKLEGK
jgi:prophage regulatory protein